MRLFVKLFLRLLKTTVILLYKLYTFFHVFVLKMGRINNKYKKCPKNFTATDGSLDILNVPSIKTDDNYWSGSIN